MAHLVALITDLELAAELVATAEAAGHDVDVCTDEPDTWEACEERTELLVVDTSSDSIDGVTLVDSMRAGGELQGVRTLAFHRRRRSRGDGARGGGRLRCRRAPLADAGRRRPAHRGTARLSGGSRRDGPAVSEASPASVCRKPATRRLPRSAGRAPGGRWRRRDEAEPPDRRG